MCAWGEGQDEEGGVVVRASELVGELATRGIRCLAVAKTDPKALWGGGGGEKSNSKKEKDEKGEEKVDEENDNKQDEQQEEKEEEAKDKKQEEHWTLVCLLSFLDPPRPDAKRTIALAQSLGVPMKMVTGDHVLIARETSKQLGLGTEIILGPNSLPLLNSDGSEPESLLTDYGKAIEMADGFAQVFPQHKYVVVAALKGLGYRVGMTGDGVNDVPALSKADVGIAVQGATDAARASADIVLTEPGLNGLIHGIQSSREVFGRMTNFATYRVAASSQLLLFFFIAVLSFHPQDFQQPNAGEQSQWPYFYRMPVLLLMLITLLNDVSMISIGYDNVVVSHQPCTWNLRVLFLVSGVLGAFAVLSSLLLLYACLDSWNPGGVFAFLGLDGLSYGEISTAMFLKVAISDFLTLLSARGGEYSAFGGRRPAQVLLVAAVLALTASTLVALFWPKMVLDEIEIEGLARSRPFIVVWVWLFSLGIFLVQDACKAATYMIIRRCNLFGYVDDHHAGYKNWKKSLHNGRGESRAAVERRQVKSSLAAEEAECSHPLIKQQVPPPQSFVA